MAMSPKMELRSTQALVMTPQLQQAIKLLQLSNLELNAYIEQELERNPALERDDGADASAEGDSGSGDDDGEIEAEDAEDAEDAEAIALDRLDLSVSEGFDGADAPLDAGYENEFDDGRPGAADGAMGGEQAAWSQLKGPGGGPADAADAGFAPLPDHGINLRQHLLGQLHLLSLAANERPIAARLVEGLDEAGYLVEPLDEIALKLGAEPTQIAAVLERLQGLDPPGVGARDLAECLALQLMDRDRFDPAMQILVRHLDLLAAHDLNRLMRLCRVDAEDLSDMIAEIRALNPKPGLAYDYEMAQPVVPDVFVRRDAAGAWRLELNSDTLPRLLVNSRYSSLIETKGGSREERAYVAECLNNANWLVKSLDQRARTILRVAGEIARQQEEFLNRGVQHLRPLNLRTVAEAVNLHESTVSRVTANKYMATPRGIHELRYFFTSAIASAEGGDAHSAAAVKHRLKRLIDAEAAAAVLSDDRLVELLRGDGIDIARRTVAKYRETMGIPSSVQRRRQKRLAI